jgi:hypothetical protein
MAQDHNDIYSIVERLRILEEGLDKNQKSVNQLSATFKPKTVSVLTSPKDPKNPMAGKLVGGCEESEEKADKTLVELDYAHDFRGWQRDAQAAGLEIKRQPQDETGNITNSFIAVKPGNEDSSGGVKVGHFDGQKGSGILAASPEEYQSTIGGGFGQHMDTAYQKDVTKFYSGQDAVKKLAELAGCKVNEVSDDEQGGSIGGTVEPGTIPHDDINLDADDIPWHASGTLPGESPALKEAEMSEDILEKVKSSFVDYLKSIEDKYKDSNLKDKTSTDTDLKAKDTKDRDLKVKETPVAEDPTELDPAGTDENLTEPVIEPTYESAPVKTVTNECGLWEMHGNEQTGFEIRRGGRSLSSRFKNLDEAELAVKMFAHRRNKADEAQDYMEER